MQHISSKDNQIVKEVKSLHSSKGRKQKNRYMIEGRRIVEQAMIFGAPFCYAVIEEGKEEEYQELEEAFYEKRIPLYSAPAYLMEKMCDAKTPQGILCVIERQRAKRTYHGPVIALDGIADPGNLGTILRTAQAFGVKDVLLSQSCADAESPKCMRSAMGAHFALNLERVEELDRTIQSYREAGYLAIGGHLEGKHRLDQAGKVDKQCLVVIGSEAEGITDAVRDACDALYCIPMTNDAESLNAAVAAGILMYIFFAEGCRI